jgi:hypothetical protein
MNLTRSAPRFAATGPLGPRGSRHDPARWKPWPTNASGAFGCPVCGLFVFSRANNVTEHCKQCTGDRNCEVEKWALRQGLGGAAKNTSAASEVEPKYGVSAQGHAPQTAPVTTAGRMKITQLESHMGDLVLLRDLPPLELLARLVVVDGERLSMQGRADLAAASRKAVEHAIASFASCREIATSRLAVPSGRGAVIAPCSPKLTPYIMRWGRRHRTCVHQRARWRAPPWGTQRRTRHRRMTTDVSSTSSFRRRRRRRCLRMPRSQSRRAPPDSHALQRRKLHAKAYSGRTGRSLATLAACIRTARS